MLRFPIHTDSPLHARPWMNWLLILANIIVLIAEARSPGLMRRYALAANGLRLGTFLTYAFLHISWPHLLLNMLVLYLMGNSINDRLGHAGYLAFYLAGAVFAGIGFIASGGDAVVGASGAVGAVMGAYLVLHPRSSIIAHVGLGVMEVPSMYFVVVYFLYNVLMSFATPVGVQQVAYEAHIAGMVFGFAVLLGLVLVGLLPRHEGDLLAVAAQWNQRRRDAGEHGRGA
jgi:membrane associated rhomboid family serine protease